MKAPVAANRLNLALTTKNTINGPSSVASLNSGCGWVLSITQSIKSFSPSDLDCRHPSRRRFAPPQDEDFLDLSLILRSAPRARLEGCVTRFPQSPWQNPAP